MEAKIVDVVLKADETHLRKLLRIVEPLDSSNEQIAIPLTVYNQPEDVERLIQIGEFFNRIVVERGATSITVRGQDGEIIVKRSYAGGFKRQIARELKQAYMTTLSGVKIEFMF
jgi:hypothetical protein